MRSRLALNLVLVAAAAGLLWLVLQPAREQTLPRAPVTELEQDRITTIHIQAAGRPGVELTRSDSGWRMTAPLDAPADAFRVQALLGLAAAQSRQSFDAADDDLTQYGLDPPRAAVRFDGRMLRVGDTDPVAGNRYVLSGGKVHVVEDRWFSQIFGDPQAWMDPRPLMGAERVTAMDLPGARWQLEDGRWRRTPADPSMSADTGPALADAWIHARALAVGAYDPDLAWADSITVTVGGQREPFEFRLARSEQGLLLGREDLAVQYRFLVRQGAVLLGEGTP